MGGRVANYFSINFLHSSVFFYCLLILTSVASDFHSFKRTFILYSSLRVLSLYKKRDVVRKKSLAPVWTIKAVTYFELWHRNKFRLVWSCGKIWDCKNVLFSWRNQLATGLPKTTTLLQITGCDDNVFAIFCLASTYFVPGILYVYYQCINSLK